VASYDFVYDAEQGDAKLLESRFPMNETLRTFLGSQQNPQCTFEQVFSTDSRLVHIKSSDMIWTRTHHQGE